MRHTGAALFPIALMGLLAALTFWLDQTTQLENSRDGKRRHDPDYIVDRFEVRRFGPDGELQHSLVAQKMLHYPDDDSTTVTAPQLTYHSRPPAYLSSDTAWLDKDGKHVRLDDHVRITRESGDDRPAAELNTSVLYVVPDDEHAYTDAPVTLTQGMTVIRGKGLDANNKTHISTLSGPVRGTIYPKQTNRTTPIHEPSRRR